MFLTVTEKKRILREERLPAEPLILFKEWYDLAAGSCINLHEAMALSTVSGNGRPSCRLVLLKGFGKDGFVFFTNYNSRKAKEMENNKNVALTFWWNTLGRQVRIEGTVEKISEKESDEYFRTRPRGSQIGAWASEQSSEITNREVLEKQVIFYEEKFKGKEVPRPPHWGGYRVMPSTVEFWQARLNRLHDRIKYTLLPDKSWKIERLAP
ncbi:MAG: pyridoxamine 5'-phosphate oxidase [Bacteroidetes bacterium]|nr:pyridoxamine 5'-phosphate oxidase [Bacteroidota bacterium]